MLFEISENTKELKDPLTSNPLGTEKILEQLISLEHPGLLKKDVFGEDLFFICRQSKTSSGKISDILALDSDGNVVIIELKKEKAKLGIELQALQYLADVGTYKGKEFLDYCRKKIKSTEYNIDSLEEDIKSFLQNQNPIDLPKKWNQAQSIILIAQSFDQTLISMGQWLAERGVPFRCIAYQIYEIEGKKYISFSTIFDQLGRKIKNFKFDPADKMRSHSEPQIFWYNVGINDEDSWKKLVSLKFIAAGFEGKIKDKGHTILNDFVPGDRIVAYASGHGIVGFGTIEENSAYYLVEQDKKSENQQDEWKSNFWNGGLMHRRQVRWDDTAPTLNNSIPTKDLEGLYHPIQTRQAFPDTQFDSALNFSKEKWKINNLNLYR